MLPSAFLLRMQEMLGDEYPAFLQAMEAPSSVHALRCNPIKIKKENFLAAFPYPLSPLPYCQDGMLYEAEKVGNLPLHHAGAFYGQDPGAMATLCALGDVSGLRAVDLCAAPGGKSTQLAAMLTEQGFLVANEINLPRCRILAGNIERLGCRNTAVTNCDVPTLAAFYPSFFDIVLLDAPCSGEGMFRKYEVAAEEWSPESVLMCAQRQKELLKHAASMVRGGGYLLYSTCTFSLEENEMNVDTFLTENPMFSVAEVPTSLVAVTSDGVAFDGCSHPQQLKLCRRFYPHIFAGEGQFFCLMRRNGATNEKPPKQEKRQLLSKSEEDCVRAFWQNTMDTPQIPFCFKHKDTVVLAREDMPLPSYGVYAAGVTLGTLKKGRIEPHHQFFSAYGAMFRRKCDLTEQPETLHRYLRGETFPVSLADGYAVVTVAGCALGGIKVSGGIAKNHYPKGQRLLS